jgi:hypothetical protein
MHGAAGLKRAIHLMCRDLMRRHHRCPLSSRTGEGGGLAAGEGLLEEGDGLTRGDGLARGDGVVRGEGLARGEGGLGEIMTGEGEGLGSVPEDSVDGTVLESSAFGAELDSSSAAEPSGGTV